jgi:hypothetical protein
VDGDEMTVLSTDSIVYGDASRRLTQHCPTCPQCRDASLAFPLLCPTAECLLDDLGLTYAVPERDEVAV